MLFVLGEQDSIASQYLAQLRDVNTQQNRQTFRNNLFRLGFIMAYEISKKLTYTSTKVDTPLGSAAVSIPENSPVLIPVMRAGLPYYNGFLEVFETAESGFVGVYRKEQGESLTIQFDYLATPTLEDRDVIIIDPMLATGRSITDAIQHLKKRGKPRHLHLASVVASPEGIQYLKKNVGFPFSIWTFAVDERLNDQFYIVPGLGDAGDLSFGPKS
jgi:uracil phosphoribosyltransferase